MGKSSLITDDFSHCILCGRPAECTHHVFGGANRTNSTTYKCLAPLCNNCHNFTNDSVHFNRKKDLALKAYTQKKFEEIYGHDKFMAVFGKNYI